MFISFKWSKSSPSTPNVPRLLLKCTLIVKIFSESVREILKDHLTTSAFCPDFICFKKEEIFIPLEVYLCSDCMQKSYLQLQLTFEDFLAAAIIKSLFFKMTASVMIAECGTSHHYQSLEKNSKACLRSSSNIQKVKILTEHCVNYNVLFFV